MNALAGTPVGPRGARLHVCGAEHPLQRSARLFAGRAAGSSLALHTAIVVAVSLASIARAPAPPTSPPADPHATTRPVTLLSQPAIDSRRPGPVIADAKPADRAADAAEGSAKPVLDVEAEAPTISDMNELGLDAVDGGVVGVGRGGLGLGGPAVGTPPGGSVARSGDVLDWAETMPRLASMPRPEYPAIAREAGIEGLVLVRATIGIDGRVIATEVVEGLDVLAAAAIAAVRVAIFTPGLQGDRPVSVRVAVPVRFALR
jgi:protein TonB